MLIRHIICEPVLQAAQSKRFLHTAEFAYIATHFAINRHEHLHHFVSFMTANDVFLMVYNW